MKEMFGANARTPGTSNETMPLKKKPRIGEGTVSEKKRVKCPCKKTTWGEHGWDDREERNTKKQKLGNLKKTSSWRKT